MKPRRVPILAPLIGAALLLGPVTEPAQAQDAAPNDGAPPASQSPASPAPASPKPASQTSASQTPADPGGQVQRENGPTVLRLETGSLAAVYYPVGVALCRLPNQHRPETGLRCAAVPSEGSIANIEALRAGEADLALAQTDAAADAVAGEGAFAEAGPMDGLRSVMSLYPEPVTIVARADSGIASLTDLQGKRVSLGRAGSGQRTLAEALIGALGWTAGSFAETPDMATEELAAALCGGQIDAYLVTIGHPALVVRETTRGCDARLVPVTGPAVDGLVSETPALVTADIPGGVYRGNPDPTPSFGPGATLFARAETPEAEVRAIVAGIFGDFDMLTGLHSALAGLSREASVSEGLAAPLHPGAESYYREAGLLP